MKFTDDKQVIDYLYSLPHFHKKSDLSYIKRVLHQLGDPQDQVKTIHVTGTNGKGSTSYYLSNLLMKAGQKTGLFVSPYIREFNERIQINNKNIPNQDLTALANEVLGAITTLQRQEPDFNLVTFEFEVALAFLYFAEQNCDYAVIEVGIGAKHDKTNVITPEVSIITTIGLDHEQIIGPTIQDIAREKSGIIKANRPVVVGAIPDEVREIIKNAAQDKNAPLLKLNRDFKVESDKKISYEFENKKLIFKSRPLVESYDIVIAVTAFYQLNLALDDQAVEEAINATQIPGRYQTISNHPAIILDGAHNIQAMTNLLQVVHAKARKQNGQVYALITMMKDKDLEQVFSLFDKDDQVLLTTLNYPRVAKKNDFPLDVQKRYNYEEDYRRGFTKLKKKLKINDILLVTGSFYLVSAVLNWKGDRDAS